MGCVESAPSLPAACNPRPGLSVSPESESPTSTGDQP